MSRGQLTRRQFLILGGVLATGTVVGQRVAAQPATQGAAQTAIIYRLSLRGRRGSKAGKLHNANFRFATEQDADTHRAHPGDNSRIVALIVSADEFDRLFTSRNSSVADLRKLRGPVLVGDCDRNGEVEINELIRGVNIALGNASVAECPPFDRVMDGRVSVDELVKGVRNALSG